MKYYCYVWAIFQALIAESFATELADMHMMYRVEYDFAITGLLTIGRREGVTSVGECAWRCVAETGCGNANYDATTFQCDLLTHTSSIFLLQGQKNARALLGLEDVKNVTANISPDSFPQQPGEVRNNTCRHFDSNL